MTLNDNILPLLDEVKDSGVIVDSHLSFDARITKTVARAFTLANLIHKCCTSRDAATMACLCRLCSTVAHRRRSD